METKTTYNVRSNGSNGRAQTEASHDEILPPHNKEAEDALVGSILIDSDRFHELNIEPQMFFTAFNREIFKAFIKLREKKRPIDFLTVSDVLRGKGIERDADLAGLLTVVPTSINMHSYADIVRDEWNRRRLITLSGKMATAAFDSEENLEDIISVALDGVRVVGGDIDTDEPISSVTLATRTFEELTRRRTDKEYRNKVHLSTGFLDLDRLLNGIERDSLVIFAGRPGMGKSLFEQAVRLHVAQEGRRVAVFNLEMSSEQLMQRQLSSRLQIPYTDIRSPFTLNETQWEAVGKALGEMSELNIYVDDSASLTIDELESKMHRLYANHGYFDLITVDYLQLMRGNKNAKNRIEEIGQISRGLKRIAKELKTVVWANAQVNRGVEHRQKKMPLLADLRESGDIEQDADIVMFLMREEYYDETTSRPNIADVSVAKNRNGDVGEISLYFNGSRMRFANLTRETVSF